MTSRITLRRSDGTVYLNRWGFETRWGGVFVHKMDAPDPGVDLHNHPWAFGSFILKGGYVEERAKCEVASELAERAERAERNVFLLKGTTRHVERGILNERRKWSWKWFPLDECHRICNLKGDVSWSLVIHGPKRRKWGFFEPEGYVTSREYATERRDLWEDK